MIEDWHGLNCPLCGGANFVRSFLGKDRLHGFPGEFWVMECTSCGLYSLFPHLSTDEINNFYPKNYLSFPIAIEDEPVWFTRLDRFFGQIRRCEEVIRLRRTPGRILDIGCATGIFLDGMRKRNWEVIGIEPSKEAALYARDRLNLEIINGVLEDTSFKPESFDVITLWDVLEHLPDPNSDLAKIYKLLKKDGLLILSLPNADSYERFIFGRYWAGWDVPRHFNVYNLDTINLMLQKHSFKVQKIKSFTGRHGVFVLNMQFLLTDWNISEQAKKILMLIFRSLLIRIIIYPYYRVVEKFNRSSIMTVIACKK